MPVRLTHIGGPTLLVEAHGWRILSDPTFDPPGRRYGFGWGTSSVKITGPAIPAKEVGPLDLVLLSHVHHADNLDDTGRALLPGARSVVDDTVGRQSAGSGQHPGARALGNDNAQRSRAGGPDHHGDPLPARTAAEQADRR